MKIELEIGENEITKKRDGIYILVFDANQTKVVPLYVQKKEEGRGDDKYVKEYVIQAYHLVRKAVANNKEI